MPGRTIEDILQIRQLVAEALDKGIETPNEIIQWIERKGVDAPAVATVIRIMRQNGYRFIDGTWTKDKK